MTTKPETSPMTDAAIERLCELLTRQPMLASHPCALRNPDGPEAAALIRSQAERVKALESALTEASDAADVILAHITAEIGKVIAAATDEDVVPLLSEYGVEITAKQLRRLYDATDRAALNTGEPT